MSNYITTFSKINFNPLDPKPEEILIDDIAHALSLMTRANGHFPEFYSVAQHCIACCEEAIEREYSNKVALACLLHDASEAYMSDVTRPVKRNLDGYLKIEKNLQDIIYNTFLGEELSEVEQEKVNSIDDALLHNEFLHYMNEEIPVKDGKLVSKPQFKFIDFKEVENKYKELFHRLINNL